MRALIILATLITSASTQSLRASIQRVETNRHLFEFSSECNYESTPKLYVSSTLGNNWNMENGWGLSPEKPFKTIQHAVDKRQPCQTIYIMEGTYRNTYFGKSLNHQNKIVNLNGVSDLKLLAYSNAKPVLEFDGPAAILGGNFDYPVSNIEIAGLEIKGPNQSISYEDAMDDRVMKRSFFNGRGIAIWAGHHIFIHDMEVHHCPASGIRVNKGDYVTISHNKVYSNTWWSSSAESAIVLAESRHIDENEGIKMKLTHNTVYDNINKIPYYNKNYDWDYSPIGNKDCSSYPACEQELVEGCPWECRYGKKTQDYIIDGMGVYVTRNKDTYLHGQMELSYNTAFRNGINGVVFHRTNRGVVKQNIIYENGLVPRLDKTEQNPQDWHLNLSKSRQSYSGLVINNSEDVKLWSNNVSARYEDDCAFKLEVDGSGPPPPLAAGGNNRVCKGLVDTSLDNVVRYDDNLETCGIKYIEISCGEKCHLIQWPYKMGASYNPVDAYENCESDCDDSDCKAFSLQDDYRPGNEGKKFCFLYEESKTPKPDSCANDPFNQSQPSCSYFTTNGQFFITPSAKLQYNVQDLL